MFWCVSYPLPSCYFVHDLRQKKLREAPAQYDLQNVFGIGKSTREAQVATETKRTASGVRNVFRSEVRSPAHFSSGLVLIET